VALACRLRWRYSANNERIPANVKAALRGQLSFRRAAAHLATVHRQELQLCLPMHPGAKPAVRYH
jgi:hypothetical protein